MRNTDIQQQFEALPLHLQVEVANFIEFLNTKKVIKEEVARKKKKKKPKAGFLKGTFKMSPDFDASLEDFKDYM